MKYYGVMKVIAEIKLDSTWDAYDDSDVEFLEIDLFEELSKEGIMSAKIIQVIPE